MKKYKFIVMLFILILWFPAFSQETDSEDSDTETLTADSDAAKIIVKLLIDIDKGRWNLHPRTYGKAKPMCLPFPMVRILPQNHHFYVTKRRQVKGIKNVIRRRKNPPRPVFFVYSLK